MNLFGKNAEVFQGFFYRKNHLLRAAQEISVHVFSAEKQSGVGAAFVAVNVAFEQIAAERLAA